MGVLLQAEATAKLVLISTSHPGLPRSLSPPHIPMAVPRGLPSPHTTTTTTPPTLHVTHPPFFCVLTTC
ncbi:hypothetical protein E2C01_082285 [Portunus trituberculatus]|uniref:Uncharacterized protein n=1 Tax=Portunus trituberculatus TaxID=210409 RepID=A0A5B7IYT3_PORTR|nr:hypothetical protein [Portunus trituberculatus]